MLSSAGRAPALHAGGQRFDPAWLHQTRLREANGFFLSQTKKYYCAKEIYLVEAQDESVRELILDKWPSDRVEATKDK